MGLANRRGVLRRRPLLLATLGPLALATLSNHAAASGAFLPGDDQSPVEQRLAVAVGPARTTVWTSLRFDGSAGPVGVVVPVPPLAALDLSSDAWLEALEVATAPRVFPPEGVSPYCPGEQGDPDPFHVAGDLGHTPTLAPSEVLVLDDAGAVALWAAANGLALGPELASALSGMQGKRFLAARFATPGGEALTRTLRVVVPSAEAVLPLALTRAGSDDLRVTTWLLGPGRASLPSGALPVEVDEAELVWDADAQASNYAEERMNALTLAGFGGALLEASSHEALSHNIAVGNSASIEGVVTSYFERAAAYGEATDDPATCTASAAAALASASVVSPSCPRADQGVVDGADTCAEAPAPGETDPERLRCGDGADDLAVALSGLSPSGVWLTRFTLRIPAGASGADRPLGFPGGPAVTPVLDAEGVSVAACEEPGSSTSSSSSGSGSGSSSSSGSGGPGSSSSSGGSSGSGSGGTIYYDETYSGDTMGCGCSGTVNTSDSYYDDGSDDSCSGDTSDSYYDDSSSDDCSGDTSDSYYDDSSSDDCSGDTSDSYYDDSSSDDCSGDSSDSYYDDSSDDCSGDSSDSYYDDSSSDCSSDTSGGSSDSCSSSSGSGSGEECSIAGQGLEGPKRRRAPKLSAMTLGFLAVLAPIRRLFRPRRRRGA